MGTLPGRRRPRTALRGPGADHPRRPADARPRPILRRRLPPGGAGRGRRQPARRPPARLRPGERRGARRGGCSVDEAEPPLLFAPVVHSGDTRHPLRDPGRHGGGRRARQEPSPGGLLRRARPRPPPAGGGRAHPRVLRPGGARALPRHAGRHGADRAHSRGRVPDAAHPDAVDLAGERAHRELRGGAGASRGGGEGLAVHGLLVRLPRPRRRARPRHPDEGALGRAARGAARPTPLAPRRRRSPCTCRAGCCSRG